MNDCSLHLVKEITPQGRKGMSERKEFSSYEESSQYYQMAFLRERRERQAVERCFIRLVKWLRGEDPEFGKEIIKFRDERKEGTEVGAVSETEENWMMLPHNAEYPIETHLHRRNSWCEKVGCAPISDDCAQRIIERAGVAPQGRKASEDPFRLKESANQNPLYGDPYR